MCMLFDLVVRINCIGPRVVVESEFHAKYDNENIQVDSV